MWAAPHRISGSLYLGHLQNQWEIDAAQTVLQWATTLEARGQTAPPVLQLVIMPYGRTVLFAPPYVGVPVERIQRRTLWHDDPEERADVFDVQLEAAIRLAENWLAETVPWAERPLHRHGELRGIIDGRPPRAPNPQAPHGRWTENVTPPVWCYAWAVVLAQRMMLADQVDAVQEQQARWLWLQALEGSILSWDVVTMDGGIQQFAPPVGLEAFEATGEFCRLAAAVSALHAVAETQGDEFLWAWLQVMHRDQIPIGARIDGSAMWRIGTALAGTSLEPLPAPCQAYDHDDPEMPGLCAPG